MLDDIEERTLAQFFPGLGQRTIKQVEKGIGRSYERAYTTLRHLEERKILKSEMLGGTLIFRIKEARGSEAQQVFCNLMIEKMERYEAKHKIVAMAVRKLKERAKPRLVVIFGSHAKGAERKDSDVDILCVSEDRKLVEREAASISREYGISFSPVIVSIAQAFNIKNENRAFFEDLRNVGVVVYGLDLFFDMCYGGEGDGI